jgi:hypothetical protein
VPPTNTAKTARKRTKKKRTSAPAASRGLDARRLASAAPPTAVATLARTVGDDGGTVLATYRDPRFDPARIKADQVARTGGAPSSGEE